MNKKSGQATDAAEPGPTLSKGSRRLQFFGEEFVLDTVSGLFYRLTPAAHLVLRAYAEGVQSQQFPGLLKQHYGIDPASAARDIELLLNQMVSLGLLDPQHERIQEGRA
ncbi:MAG: PqqD family protein [Hydrogenophaga sp.]|uniref:PqqD family protein n=1 Tax=Hydrogenophaga sp. TaxID=1904254 RepID=UPI0027201F14|nr:PqqD family protein [Hydrogenophaga sp.]MDO9030862.1 PqqD family protein [Hydrogenophaga sp.]